MGHVYKTLIKRLKAQPCRFSFINMVITGILFAACSILGLAGLALGHPPLLIACCFAIPFIIALSGLVGVTVDLFHLSQLASKSPPQDTNQSRGHFNRLRYFFKSMGSQINKDWLFGFITNAAFFLVGTGLTISLFVHGLTLDALLPVTFHTLFTVPLATKFHAWASMFVLPAMWWTTGNLLRMYANDRRAAENFLDHDGSLFLAANPEFKVSKADLALAGILMVGGPVFAFAGFFSLGPWAACITGLAVGIALAVTGFDKLRHILSDYSVTISLSEVRKGSDRMASPIPVPPVDLPLPSPPLQKSAPQAV